LPIKANQANCIHNNPRPAPLKTCFLNKPLLELNTFNHIRSLLFKLILTYALTLFYLPLAKADNQTDLKALRERIQILQKELTDKEKLKQDITSTLQETEQTISHISHRLAQLVEQDRKANEDLRQLQAQHEKIEQEIDIEQDQLGKLYTQHYLNNQKDHLQLILNQQDPNQIARSIYYYKQLSLARSNSINILLENQQKLAALTRVSLKKREEIISIQAEQSAQHQKLTEEKNKHQAMLSQLSNQITQQQREINTLKSDEKRITDLVQEIGKIIVQKDSRTTAIVNNKLPSATTTRIPFISLKGQLNLPVFGKLIHRFGDQRSGSQVTWKGLFIESSEGQDVKAIADGQIVFSDWFRGFGHLIIIDHGNSYMSLYGNNKMLHKQVGDIIHSGDTVATVGNSGSNPDSGLYFELRYKGKPFDPLTWVKIE